MNFVYREPAIKRGACRSESILYLFSYHLRIASVVPADKRNKAQAALALCTAAMERGYSMWTSGTLVQQRVERRGRKSAHSFVAVPWAERATKYLTIIKKLTDSKWEEIVSTAAEFSDVGGEILWGGGDETSEGPDPRLEIQLSSDEEEPAQATEAP
ncbi:hypothetical protein B0H10DRAFT_2044967 [Mycena sp. CBHHK59/15]|nr:hypothetical protein B0H10DRAFT_2091872 [Mycena sp. CBHHK59/15]KAJ6614524.1 hypothetical protein B0H10DRAFT_2044967 [Mycena sp. CBHHK59/15]